VLTPCNVLALLRIVSGLNSKRPCTLQMKTTQSQMGTTTAQLQETRM
jgi:hypothetical protein